MKSWLLSPYALISSFVILMGSVLYLYFFFSGNRPTILGDKNQAELELKLETNRPVVQQPFRISVTANTKTKKINAVGVYLRFDPQILQLTSLDTRASFCQFYPEKKFDNSLGLISLACGGPHPGAEGTNTLMSLEFIPLSEGTTMLYTDPKSQLMQSDGKGTNILTKYPNLSVPVFTGL